MASTVSYMLKTKQPVSDARLIAGVQYTISTVQHYVVRPTNARNNPRVSQRLFEEACLVLDAAEERGLERMLQLNVLGRLRILLETFQKQMHSQGLV